MIVSSGFFSLIIYVAVIVTVVSPLVMLALLIRDMRKDELW